MTVWKVEDPVMQLLALGGLGDGQIERNREVEPAGGGLLSGLVGLKGEGGGGLRGDHADGLAEGGGGGGLVGVLEHGGLLGLRLGFLLAAGLLFYQKKLEHCKISSKRNFIKNDV